MKNIENTKIMIERLYIMAKSYKADEVITELFDDLIDQLLEELQSNFEFPEEFAITYGKRK